MPTITKSWKTTVAGIGLILSGLAKAVGEYASGGFNAIQWQTLIAAFIAGFGLIFAKDASVSNATAPGPAVHVPPQG